LNESPLGLGEACAIIEREGKGAAGAGTGTTFACGLGLAPVGTKLKPDELELDRLYMTGRRLPEDDDDVEDWNAAEGENTSITRRKVEGTEQQRVSSYTVAGFGPWPSSRRKRGAARMRNRSPAASESDLGASGADFSRRGAM